MPPARPVMTVLNFIINIPALGPLPHPDGPGHSLSLADHRHQHRHRGHHHPPSSWPPSLRGPAGGGLHPRGGQGVVEAAQSMGCSPSRSFPR